MNIHHHDPVHRPSQTHHVVDGQLQGRQEPKLVCEKSPVMPLKSSRQVTIAAYQRKTSRHGDLGITHHNSDTERQRGDLNSSTRDENSHGTQQKILRTQPYCNQAQSINAINQNQCSPPMLCGTHSYLSRPYQSQPYWTGYSVANQNHSSDNGAAFSPVGCFSPYVASRLPPTLADTIKVDEGLRKNSLNRALSPITSPLAYKLESGIHDAASLVNGTLCSKAGNTVVEQQESNNIRTSPRERAACSLEQIFQPFNEQPQNTPEETEYQPGEDSETKGDGKCGTISSPGMVIGVGSDLDFLSCDWDLNNFDFLDDKSGFDPASNSNQATSWDTMQNILPPEHPTLAFDSGFSTDIGAGLTNFQAHSTFATEKPLEDHFDQFGGYLPTQSTSTDLDIFHNAFSNFTTHTFPTQSVSTTQANDRTSHGRKSKDQMLVNLKHRGYSYKDIKVIGQFEEAESTLRGRYRTLTKPKEARVRKPEWGDREIALLLQAVAAHTNAANGNHSFTNRSASTVSRRASKIPWKQVAEYMALRGAYKYGNATVKKKWTEVLRAHEGR